MTHMWRTTLSGRCPSCGRGELFGGWLRLNAVCDVCGVRFDRHAGNWLGPTVLAYGIGGIAAVVAGLLLVPRYGFFRGLAPVLGVVATVAALAGLRPVKAWWTWVLWRTGLVVREEETGADND